MASDQSSSSTGWKSLFNHVPHAGTVIAVERVLEFLIGNIESDFAEIRAEIEDVKWAPFKRAEQTIKLIDTLKSKRDESGHSLERENDLLEEAYQDFRLTAAALHDEQRCKALISATVCAQLLGRNAEAGVLRKMACEDLRSRNAELHRQYSRKTNALKRYIHSNVKVSKLELGAASAGLAAAVFLSGGFAAPIIAVGALLGTSTAAGRLTEDRERVSERLSATKRFGEEVFGGRWHGPVSARRSIWTIVPPAPGRADP